MQADLRLAGQCQHARVQAQARHVDQLSAAVEQRTIALPGRDTGRLILLLQAARRTSDAALELLGADVVHFIPERLRDGYGLQPAAIEHIDRLLFDQTRGQIEFQAVRDLLDPFPRDQLDAMVDQLIQRKHAGTQVIVSSPTGAAAQHLLRLDADDHVKQLIQRLQTELPRP